MASLRARGPHVAETDGTPRYRKSKPPKGAGSRNSRPSAKAKKRAAVRDTLPSGSTLDTSRDSHGNHDNPHDKVTPVAGVDMPALAQANSVVRTTMPKMIRAEEPRETDDLHRTSPRSTAPLAGGTPGPQPRTIRPSLGSTLRMELTVHKGAGSSEPNIQLRSTAPLGHAGRSDAPSTNNFPNEPENPKRTRKPTTPGFAPAFPDPSAPRPSRFNTSGVGAADGGHARFDETLRRGGDYEPPASSRSSSIPRSMATTSPSMSTTGAGNTQRPRRPRRPGERTLIMQRKVKTGSKRDWVFVVLLVAALGLTASMFLSQQAPAEEVVDAAAYDDPQEEGQDPFAPTTLKPWHDRDKAPDQRQSDTSALTAREASAAANSVQATELKSQPAGAEVLVGNAVVGSTPVRVARGSTDLVYVLRLAGHESKVVRVGPNSPPSILVQLGPLMPASGNVPAAPSGTP